MFAQDGLDEENRYQVTVAAALRVGSFPAEEVFSKQSLLDSKESIMQGDGAADKAGLLSR